MSIFKVLERRSDIEGSLAYVYRGEGHEHPISMIEHMGGNIFTVNPIKLNKETGLVESVDLRMMVREFEFQASLHTDIGGRGEKLYKHYVVSLADINEATGKKEELTAYEWMEHIQNDLMPALGFSEENKYTCVIHEDSGKQHVHIVACLVNLDGTLVSTNDDVWAGFESMRRLERKYPDRLTQLESPQNNDGWHYSDADMRYAKGNRNTAISRDEAAIIRARMADLKSSNGGKLPNTMSKLVIALKQKGIDVKCRVEADENNKNAEIAGISFKLEDSDRWISGSKVKSTQYSFTMLQKRMGVNYNPERDNALLLATNVKEAMAAKGLADQKNDYTFSIGVKINYAQLKQLKKKRPPVRARRIPKSNKYWVDLSMMTSKYARDVAMMAKEIMEMMNAIFDFFSGKLSDEDWQVMLQMQHEQAWKEYKDEMYKLLNPSEEVEYESTEERLYDMDSHGEFFQMTADMEWYNENETADREDEQVPEKTEEAIMAEFVGNADFSDITDLIGAKSRPPQPDGPGLTH